MRSFNFRMTATSLQFDSWLLSPVNEPNKNLIIHVKYFQLFPGVILSGLGGYIEVNFSFSGNFLALLYFTAITIHNNKRKLKITQRKKLTTTAIHFWVAISASILKPGVN